MKSLRETEAVCGAWRCLSDRVHTGAPTARVGHSAHILDSCHFAPTGPKIIILGGANLSDVCDDVYSFEFADERWDKVLFPYDSSPPGFGRYEHASAILSTGRILVFGGATQDVPLKSMVSLELSTVFKQIDDKDGPVQLVIKAVYSDLSDFDHEARTQHTTTCLTEFDQLLVFSGGGLGSEPVSDTKVHMYDSIVDQWSVIHTSGTPPHPRLGHVIVYQKPMGPWSSNVRSRTPCGILYVHGGMSGSQFFDDFHMLDFTKGCDIETAAGVWSQIVYDTNPTKRVSSDTQTSRHLLDFNEYRVKHSAPSARAAHAGVCSPGHVESDVNLIIFGGVCVSGALNDLYCFSTATEQWTEILIDGTLPRPRLDFACCLVTQLARDGGTKYAEQVDASGTVRQRTAPDIPVIQTFLFIHGGMDTDGNLFDDAWVLKVNATPQDPDRVNPVD